MIGFSPRDQSWSFFRRPRGVFHGPLRDPWFTRRAEFLLCWMYGIFTYIYCVILGVSMGKCWYIFHTQSIWAYCCLFMISTSFVMQPMLYTYKGIDVWIHMGTPMSSNTRRQDAFLGVVCISICWDTMVRRPSKCLDTGFSHGAGMTRSPNGTVPCSLVFSNTKMFHPFLWWRFHMIPNFPILPYG